MQDAPFFILIAQDDEDDRVILEQMLCQHFSDWNYHLVPSGKELIQYLLARTEQPAISLILIDINFSVENELTTLAQLRGLTHYDSLPVVALSDSVYPPIAEMFMEFGGNAYFQKPSSINESITLFNQLPSFVAVESFSTYL